MRTSTLRLRFLATLAASGAIASASLSACGGAVEGTGTGNSSGGPSSTSGSGGHGTSGGYSSSGATTLPSSSPAPLPPPEPEPFTCENGKSTTTCYTRAQLESQLRHLNRGGDIGDAGDPDADVSMYFDQNGCLPAKLVQDGCCNPAASGPAFNGSTCCYVHCTGSCCGRPFIVGGEARVAGVQERADWMPSRAPSVMPEAASEPISGTHRTAAVAETTLDPVLRERIATAWARDAAMEHASIASFARFTLELLALGAPADLVMGAQDATRDEIEHARACFSIASRHAGRNLGPGKLDVGGAAPATDLAAVVEAAIVEGCIGETLSALLAEARLARAEDADVRAALRRIANEEARHAELAWRFVGWAIANGGSDIRLVAARAFEASLARPPQAWDSGLRDVPRETLRAHGLLDEVAAREVAARAFSDVIAPCAAALAGDLVTIAA